MHDPRVPETLEGWAVLHQMFRVRWAVWQELSQTERRARASDTVRALAEMYRGEGGSTAITTLLGHRGDLMFIHFRKSFEDLEAAQLRIARLGIARTYQIPRPFAHLSVLQNVALLARFGHAALDCAAADREAWYWLEFTGLAAKADATPDALNLHQRKFLELARALASRSDLLLLDEVLSGLTPSEIDDAIRTIRTIRDLGATIVFVEHVMRAVMELTDRIVVLNQGRVIAEGLPDEVMRRSEVVTAYLGKPHA